MVFRKEVSLVLSCLLYLLMIYRIGCLIVVKYLPTILNYNMMLLVIMYRSKLTSMLCKGGLVNGIYILLQTSVR